MPLPDEAAATNLLTPPPSRPFLTFVVAGARPNFMKVAPIYHELSSRAGFVPVLVHTGQHYDSVMSDVFLRDLGLPRPEITLDVGSGTHGAQIARVLERFEAALLKHQPDLVIVVGDVNSTVGCALASAKVTYESGQRPRVAHVEAGLRSFDRSMPEELNRVLTDAVSDYLFVTEPSGSDNLQREGIAPERIFFVGNVMIDMLLKQKQRSVDLRTWEKLGVEERQYAVVTLHRPSNVNALDTLGELLAAVRDAASRLPVIFPIHPRTLAACREHGFDLTADDVVVTPPLGYAEFLSLLSNARVVITDSGGIQEETTVLGVPCLTVRHNTERPVTLRVGTNRLVGTAREDILRGLDSVLATPLVPVPVAVPELWDGHAASRIADVLERQLRAELGP